MPTFGTVDTQTELTGGGTLIINGTRPPTDTDGAVGDYWLDTAGKTLYGPKGAGGYGATETAHPVTTPNSGGTGNFTLGIKLRCLVVGQLVGLRFYRDASTTITGHKMTLFNSSGTLVNTATSSGESGAGWVSALFSVPTPVTVNSDWVAAWYVGSNRFAIKLSTLPVSTVPAHITLIENRFGSGDVYPTTVDANDDMIDVLFQPALVAWPIANKSAP